jgi:hypothetical protein
MSNWLCPYSNEYSTDIRVAGSLPGLRTGTKGRTMRWAMGACEDEPPRDSIPDDAIGSGGNGCLNEPVDCHPERLGGGKQRGDVAEKDAALRKSRHAREMELFEVHRAIL